MQAAAPSVQPHWSRTKCVAFRFACTYFLFYSFPFPLGTIPGTEWFSALYEQLWVTSVPWIGKHILHLGYDITVLPNGSGDTTFSYVQLLSVFVLSVFVAGIWSIFDFRRPHYARALHWLCVYLRYVLAFTMWGYGMNKVIKLQFPFPSVDRLMVPYGDSSPMGLLWTFMGYSKGYTFFAGAAELVGGSLLFFRRTTTLGALVVWGVMLNIVVMNFCYDVPVKLYSANLLLMATFLLCGDARRLFDVFVLNRPTLAADLSAQPRHLWLRRGFVAVKLLFVGYVIVTTILSSLAARSTYGELAPKPALYGVFDVESFERDGATLPPLVTDSTQWRRIGFNNYGGCTVRFMDDSLQRFMVKVNPDQSTLVLTARDGTGTEHTFTYTRPDDGHFTLSGPFMGAQLAMQFTKVDDTQFTLVNRGFHWINEYPFNK